MTDLPSKELPQRWYNAEAVKDLSDAASESDGGSGVFRELDVTIDERTDGPDQAWIRVFSDEHGKFVFILGVPTPVAGLAAACVSTGRPVVLSWKAERPFGRELAGDFLALRYRPH